jgi:lysophospholipase L1-like esterase
VAIGVSLEGGAPRAKAALLVCASIAATLLLLEIGIRLVYALVPGATPQEQLSRADRTMPPRVGAAPCRIHEGVSQGAFYRRSRVREMIFELKPDVDTCWDHYGIHVKTSSAGFRSNREHVKPKPPGTLRILGLGDSFTFGYGVEYEQTWGHLLEQRLSARLNRPVEFINTGVGGFNTVNEVALLEDRGLDFDPDLIILFWCGNDVGAPQFLLEPKSYASWRSSALIDFVLMRLARLDVKARELVAVAPGIRDAEVHPEQVPAEFRDLVGKAAVFRAFDRLARISARLKLPVIVVAEGFDMLFPTNVEFAHFLRNHGFIPVELQTADARYHIGPQDGHLSLVGHEFAAAMLDRTIQSNNVLRPE